MEKRGTFCTSVFQLLIGVGYKKMRIPLGTNERSKMVQQREDLLPRKSFKQNSNSFPDHLTG